MLNIDIFLIKIYKRLLQNQIIIQEIKSAITQIIYMSK